MPSKIMQIEMKKRTFHMSEFASLGSAINLTGNQIASFSQLDSPKASQKEIREMTTLVNKANNYLANIRKEKIPTFDQKYIQHILSDIEKIKSAGPQAAKTHPRQKLNDALSKLSVHLNSLQSEKGGKRLLAEKIKGEVKIEGIRGDLPQDKDLNKHLSLAEKELANLKMSFVKGKALGKNKLAMRPSLEKHKKKIEADLKKTNAVLRRAEIVLMKGMVMHKTLAKPTFHPQTQSMINRIQKDIVAIQNNMQNRISIQILTGTLQVQAHSFRQTLDEFKSRLQALKKLRRGKKVEPVENEPEKKEQEE
jgi:hypothetical protein